MRVTAAARVCENTKQESGFRKLDTGGAPPWFIQ